MPKKLAVEESGAYTGSSGSGLFSTLDKNLRTQNWKLVSHGYSVDVSNKLQ